MNISDRYPDFLDRSSDIEASTHFLAEECKEYKNKIDPLYFQGDRASFPQFLAKDPKYIATRIEKYHQYARYLRKIHKYQVEPEIKVQFWKIRSEIEQFRVRYQELLSYPKIDLSHLSDIYAAVVSVGEEIQNLLRENTPTSEISPTSSLHSF